MEGKNSLIDLRKPYLDIVDRAHYMHFGRWPSRPVVDGVYYGIYCQALEAVRKAIETGADIRDLTRAIEEMDLKNHLLE
jgi:hypothetical protein